MARPQPRALEPQPALEELEGLPRLFRRRRRAHGLDVVSAERIHGEDRSTGRTIDRRAATRDNSATMITLAGISARSLRHLERLEVALAPRRHLVVVGPNGSGKSTLLEAIADELVAALEGRAHPAALIAPSADREALDRELRLAHFGRPMRLAWSHPERELREAFAAGRLLLAHLPDPRETSVLPAGAVADTDPKRPRERAGAQLLSRLVSRKTEEAVAHQSGDTLRAKVHEAWLLEVESALRRLLHLPALSLVYERESVHLDLPDGRRMQLGELSRGHACAVAIWAELMMRVEASRLRTGEALLDPAGVVVIDALETNLDVRLQRELLPTLAAMYPRLQLVVGTSSPLVALSLEDALVLDLATRTVRTSEEVRQGGYEALLAAMLGGRPRAASTRPPPPRPPAPIQGEDTTPQARPRSLPPPVPARALRPVSAPPPARLPPKERAPQRRGTLEGPGPWGDDE